jgi:pimeloyl-ACP methyl ester carboxylesterase
MPCFEPDLLDLDALLDKLGVARAALIGHSDGGKIALYYAAANPDRVASLVVVSAHIYVEADMASGIQSVRDDYLSDVRFQAKMRRVHGENAEGLFWGWYNGWNRPEILTWDLRAVVNRIVSPTLVVLGTADEHISPGQARELAASIPGAELYLLAGAGHMLPQDEPLQFNHRILEFLTG